MGIMDFFADIDPTKVRKADTSGVTAAMDEQKKAAASGQQMIQERISKTEPVKLERVAGPQAGQIDTSFLQALQSRLPSQAQALQGMQTQGAMASHRANEAVEMMRAQAMGQGPSVAQMQQRQAFEEAIAAQMAAQAGRGYDPAAFRQAQRAGAQLMGQQAQQAGILALQEQQAAQKAYAATAQGGQQLQLQQQELALKASQGDVQAQIQLAGLQSDLAKAQAGFQTQTSVAGAELGASQARTQAELQMQAQQQLNALTQMYVNLGMTAAEAQLKAQQSLFAADQERQSAQSAARAKMFGAITSGLSQMGAAAITGGASAMAPGAGGLAGNPAPLPAGLA